MSTVYEGGSRSSSSSSIDQSLRPWSASASIATRWRSSVGRASLWGDTRAGHEEHAAKLQLHGRRLDGLNVPEVDRVEGAAEDADSQTVDEI